MGVPRFPCPGLVVYLYKDRFVRECSWEYRGMHRAFSRRTCSDLPPDCPNTGVGEETNHIIPSFYSRKKPLCSRLAPNTEEAYFFL